MCIILTVVRKINGKFFFRGLFAAVAADNHGEVAAEFWGNVSAVLAVNDVWSSGPNIAVKTLARVAEEEELKTPHRAWVRGPDVVVTTSARGRGAEDSVSRIDKKIEGR